MDFRGPEHSVEEVYEVYILFGLCWNAVSIGTGAASYKRFNPGESNFLRFSVSFLELLRVCSTLAYC